MNNLNEDDIGKNVYSADNFKAPETILDICEGEKGGEKNEIIMFPSEENL